MKKIIALGAALVAPSLALAHGKWLVPDYQTVIATEHGKIPFYTLGSPAVWAWIGFAVITVLVAAFLHKRIPDWAWFTRFAHTNKRYIDQLAQLILGVFLVATALFWNVVIVPAEVVNSPILVTLKYAQVLIGTMFIIHLWPRYASIGLIILTSVVSITYGWDTILENTVLFTLALYFYLKHTAVSGVWAVMQKYAIDIVRIGTGISLITLACTEKLLYPELGLQFLALHHWNFMQPLFPWFSNELFVLSTGFAEMLFGIVFIFGFVTRINTIVIALFFAVSVSTMLYQASIWEVEDFVVYCAAVLLLFFSHGRATLPEMLSGKGKKKGKK
jgi:uncharacterized membrane protein YphA (DoxX/SURF4 family)